MINTVTDTTNQAAGAVQRLADRDEFRLIVPPEPIQATVVQTALAERNDLSRRLDRSCPTATGEEEPSSTEARRHQSCPDVARSDGVLITQEDFGMSLIDTHRNAVRTGHRVAAYPCDREHGH